ncbi:hypothetical protein [Streptomyces sp. NPDC001635]
MDFDSGQVRYCLKGMVARLGLSRATISRHVSYLREAGSLVWAQHGSRENVRRAQGVGGYAATATVYAAVIPPVYDRASGHRIVDSGYKARVVVDLRHRPKPVENSVLDDFRAQNLETPSLMRVKEVSQVQVEGGQETSTAQARTAKPATRRKKRKLTILGYRITAERIERARQLAASVRPLVNWIQGCTRDQLSWVLLDMVAKDWSKPQIVLWLQQLGQKLGIRHWRPQFPHRIIAAALRRQDQADTQGAMTRGPDHDQALRRSVAPNMAFQQARQALRCFSAQETVEEYPSLEDVPEDSWDLITLRQAAATDPQLLLSYARLQGRDEAARIYGTAAIATIDAAAEFVAAGFPGMPR